MKRRIRTIQEEKWLGPFGEDYTRNHLSSPDEIEERFKKSYGISRTTMNSKFLNSLDPESRILEVGCNVGSQLVLLQRMGFKNLHGIDIVQTAVKLAKQQTKNISIIVSSASYIPFETNFFDLVFTSGLLVHIAPENINKAIDEIYRCTRTYIWGMEYYAKAYEEMKWRGQDKMVFPAPFVKFYQERFKDLKLLRKEFFSPLSPQKNPIVISMFLLKKIR